MEKIIKNYDDSMVGFEERFVTIDIDKIPEKDRKNYLAKVAGFLGIAIDLKEHFSQDGLYVLKIPKDIKEGLDKGVYYFAKKSDGSGILPDVHEVAGKGIKERLTVEKVEEYGNLANGLQQYAVQQQLSQISDQLEEVYNIVKEIKEIQKAGIFGKIKAGYDLIRQASLFTDSDIQKQQILNALQSLQEGSNVVYEVLYKKLPEFEKIPENKAGIKLKMALKNKYKNHLDEKADEIEEFFKYYEKSCCLIAIAYMYLNQKEAMEAQIQQYIDNIKKLDVSNYKTILNLHPELDDNSFWFNNLENYSRTVYSSIEDFANRDYTYLELTVNGKDLLEVAN